MKTLIIKTLLVCSVLNVSAQTTRQASSLDEVAHPVATKGWIDFRPGNTLNPNTLFIENKKMFGLTEQDEMRQFKIQTDEIGFTHIRFQQYYLGLKVEGAEVILHHNGAYLKSMNGKIAEQLNIQVVPVINSELALSNAKAVCKAEKFIWEHPEIAEALSKNSNGQKDFSKPVGELLICRTDWNLGFENENLVLAYKYRIIALPMSESHEVYINAVTGNVIHKNPLSTNCNTNTGITTWYGAKAFDAGYYGFPNNAWLLESHCTGEAIMRSMRGDPIIPYSYGDADGIWTDPDGTGGYNQRAGVTTYWNVHKAYDYFRYNHNRFSYDGANAQLDAFSEVAGGLFLPSANNAAWNTIYHTMHFGSGSTSAATDDWNTIDIVGHELTHGMHQWSVGFNYSGEPGALDESFADIFGECIEAYAKGIALPDWLVGSDRGESIRSLSDPNALLPAIGGGFWGQDPDTYLGNFWFVVPGCTFDPINGTPTDYCGVHTNSGVQNFWFFLLVNGGSGTNDNTQAYNVTGIGLNSARNITYRNMDTYLTTASGYIDSREGAIRAAEDLFGSCSNEVLQTARAWYAVGVASASPDWDYAVPCGNVPNNIHYRGINTLTAGAACATTLLTGTNAIFSSNIGGITCFPGFTAEQGSAFTATIDLCDEAAYNRHADEMNAAEISEIKSSAKNEKILTEIINIYPNPAHDLIQLEFFIEEESMAEIKVFDNLGRTVTNPQLKVKTTKGVNYFKVDISALPAGMYAISIKTNEIQQQKKFVVANK